MTQQTKKYNNKKLKKTRKNYKLKNTTTNINIIGGKSSLKNVKIKNNTPEDIQYISLKLNKINHENNNKLSTIIELNKEDEIEINTYHKLSTMSYTPSINKKLITLQSLNREIIKSCNRKKEFALKEPLKILLKNGKCSPYYTEEAKKILFYNLKANKHLQVNKIIPPPQILSNCWFNAMFVSFFVSDKGRKFFHFFRYLMIEGKQFDGSIIHEKLRDAFALLNFSIDCSLSGCKNAYVLNTNNIIVLIYDSISNLNKKKKSQYILPTVNDPGNPIHYYLKIMSYLKNSDIKMLFMENSNINWLSMIHNKVNRLEYLPHVIVVEFFDDESVHVKNKNTTFTINMNGIDAEYSLDSGIVRDTEKMHFCAMVTCEKKDYAFEGYSYYKLSPMEWKNKINEDLEWTFEGTLIEKDIPFRWNFRYGYQMLMYYRIK
jgi:hypothetical protein